MRYLLNLVILPLLFATGFTASGQSPFLYRDTINKAPQTFAIVLGVSKYKYVRPLAYADKDAELFRDYLKSPGGGSIKDDNIFCLLNEQASNSNFWTKGFQWLRAKQLQKGDRLFIYLAGHGDAIDEDEFFFLGYDCNPAGDKNNYLVSGAIQLFNLKKKIAKEAVKGVQVFFIMDACRSNELPGGQEGQNFLNMAISEKKVGDIMMLATAAGQESLEDVSIGNGHGLFTYYLVDGLSGLADTEGGPDNKVTFKEIKSYVDKNVPSLALQRFKKKQDPYFCCTEFNDNVISRVDTAYLKKWLQTKKQQTRGGSNSIGYTERKNIPGKASGAVTADTTLIQTYNLFYKAVKSGKLNGPSSAEEYLQQLNKKFPRNPYTMDAGSTLAVEYINAAQHKVDQYLSCSDESSPKEKQGAYEAAINLEKAINSIKEEDEDFANSLRGRMYLLKASGDFGKEGKNGGITIAFQNAWAALSIDPNGAYILNKLALLHLENNRTDSAAYYADKAAKTAPKWACALTTLALVQQAISTNKNTATDNKQTKKPGTKKSFGVVLDGGINRSNPTYSGNTNSGFIGVKANTATTFGLGIICQLTLGTTISIRPSAAVSFETMDIDFQRRGTTGGTVLTETISVKNTAANISLPLIIKLSSKKTVPYLSLGPSFSYVLGQNSTTADILPVKKTCLAGNAGIGLDIGIPKAGIIISPELSYAAGFSAVNDKSSLTAWSVALSSLKKNAFTLSVSLRKR